MRTLALITGILWLVAVPALLALGQTASAYLQTTRGIATLRFELVDIHSVDGPAGIVPEVTLRVRGIDRTTITLAEVQFDLEWRGQRVASGLSYPALPLPPGMESIVLLPTTINQDFATETRAALAGAGGSPPFTLNGRARILLPRGDVGVWLTLQGRPRGA